MATSRTSPPSKPLSTSLIQFICDAQASGLTLTEIQSILELKDAGHRTCEHTHQLLAQHLHDIDTHIPHLRQAQERIVELQSLASTLDPTDPTDSTDPHRCQVIDTGHRH